MSAAAARCMSFVQQGSRPLFLQGRPSPPHGSYPRRAVIWNSRTADSQLCPTSRYHSSTAAKNLKTFHSSNKNKKGHHHGRSSSGENSNSRPRKRSKYRTLSIIVGLTLVTSIVSVFYERKDIKPREFLE